MDKDSKNQVISHEEALALATKIQEQLAEWKKKESPPPLKFWTLKGLEKPEVLKVLGKPKRKWIPIHEMVESLTSVSKCIFWRTVFENRDCIPHDELLKLWFNFFDSYYKAEKIKGQYFREQNDYVVPWNWPHKLATRAITHPLLIDNPIVCDLYAQARKPGYRFIRCITGRSVQTLSISKELEKALVEDDVPTFEILRLIEQEKINYSLLERILLEKSTSILRHLLEDDLIPKDVISLEEICCTCAAMFPDSYSVPLLNTIEEARPGTIKSVTDEFGRNLLWYALHNRLTGWFHPNCKLTPFLLEKGCNPNNQNQVGISWREVTDGLTPSQKTTLMISRYKYRPYLPRNEFYSRKMSFNGGDLQKIQPLKALKAH